tara:strand:+ start:1551 stop:2147 length:597 start_codon:yes stop_codon:yes gene_type:complete
MAIQTMNPQVDFFFDKTVKWQEELALLRRIILDCQLTEELKWGVPCYTYQGSNIVVIGELKTSCVLSFFKGALLQDSESLLVKPGENTQAARIIRFTDVREIIKMETTLKAFIHEAITLEKAGLKVNFKAKKELVYPEEFNRTLNENPALKAAFHMLTPGRKRAYNIYFSAPKQSKTKLVRIEKCRQRILDGKGLNDR